MPYKFHDSRRGKFRKGRYRVTNWTAYNESLRRRGDLTIWVSEDVALEWTAGPHGSQRLESPAGYRKALEAKAPDHRFPARQIEKAGYGAIWHGQRSWNGVAILARDREPLLTCKGLPGDPDDTHSRYVEAAIDGMLIGCLYLPNGNPYPGPKFDCKLAWFQRLISYAAELLELDAPVILAGDYNVMPTEIDVYKPERWVDDALFRIEVRDAFRQLVEQGWTDALRHLNGDKRIYTFWHYFRNSFARDAGLRIDHLLLNPSVAKRLVTAGVDKHVRGWDHTSDMRLCGSN